MAGYDFSGFNTLSGLLTPDQIIRNTLAEQNLSSGISPIMSTQGMNLPTVGGGGTGGNTGGFFGNITGMEKVGSILGGLNSIGNLLMGFQAMNLAKKQFRAQRGFANANLENQIKSYNTALSDRARSRAAVEDQTAEQAQSYIDRNSLTYRKI